MWAVGSPKVTAMTDSQAPVESNPNQDLLDRLKQRVEERKASGQYPEDLIEKLDVHLRRIMAHRTDRNMDHLMAELKAVDASAAFDPHLISTQSSVPGGSQIHSMLAKAQGRQTEAIIGQVQQFSDDVRVLLRSLVLAVQDGNSHFHADLSTRIDAVLERLDSYERAPADSAVAISDLRRRVEELERAAQKSKP